MNVGPVLARKRLASVWLAGGVALALAAPASASTTARLHSGGRHLGRREPARRELRRLVPDARGREPAEPGLRPLPDRRAGGPVRATRAAAPVPARQLEPGWARVQDDLELVDRVGHLEQPACHRRRPARRLRVGERRPATTRSTWVRRRSPATAPSPWAWTRTSGDAQRLGHAYRQLSPAASGRRGHPRPAARRAQRGGRPVHGIEQPDVLRGQPAAGHHRRRSPAGRPRPPPAGRTARLARPQRALAAPDHRRADRRPPALGHRHRRLARLDRRRS